MPTGPGELVQGCWWWFIFLNFSNMQHVFTCGTMTSASGAHATYFFWYCRWKWCIVPTSQSSSNTPICKRTGGMNPVCFSFLATFAVTFVCHCLNAASPSYIQLLTSECIHVYTIYIEGGHTFMTSVCCDVGGLPVSPWCLNLFPSMDGPPTCTCISQL